MLARPHKISSLQLYILTLFCKINSAPVVCTFSGFTCTQLLVVLWMQPTVKCTTQFSGKDHHAHCPGSCTFPSLSVITFLLISVLKYNLHSNSNEICFALYYQSLSVQNFLGKNKSQRHSVLPYSDSLWRVPIKQPQYSNPTSHTLAICIYAWQCYAAFLVFAKLSNYLIDWSAAYNSIVLKPPNMQRYIYGLSLIIYS